MYRLYRKMTITGLILDAFFFFFLAISWYLLILLLRMAKTLLSFGYSEYNSVKSP